MYKMSIKKQGAYIILHNNYHRPLMIASFNDVCVLFNHKLWIEKVKEKLEFFGSFLVQGGMVLFVCPSSVSPKLHCSVCVLYGRKMRFWLRGHKSWRMFFVTLQINLKGASHPRWPWSRTLFVAIKLCCCRRRKTFVLRHLFSFVWSRPCGGRHSVKRPGI